MVFDVVQLSVVCPPPEWRGSLTPKPSAIWRTSYHGRLNVCSKVSWLLCAAKEVLSPLLVSGSALGSYSSCCLDIIVPSLPPKPELVTEGVGVIPSEGGGHCLLGGSYPLPIYRPRFSGQFALEFSLLTAPYFWELQTTAL